MNKLDELMKKPYNETDLEELFVLYEAVPKAPGRLEDETFEHYKLRRKIVNRVIEAKLSGTLFWDSRDKNGNGRTYRKDRVHGDSNRNDEQSDTETNEVSSEVQS